MPHLLCRFENVVLVSFDGDRTVDNGNRAKSYHDSNLKHIKSERFRFTLFYLKKIDVCDDVEESVLKNQVGSKLQTLGYAASIIFKKKMVQIKRFLIMVVTLDEPSSTPWLVPTPLL